jgi:phytanoyl-CoA hydroxylase
MEANFFKRAAESGFSDEEAKNAFNNNMMATGFLSNYPAEFSRQHNRRWLVSSFEAGDVVLHDPFAVCKHCSRTFAIC